MKSKTAYIATILTLFTTSALAQTNVTPTPREEVEGTMPGQQQSSPALSDEEYTSWVRPVPDGESSTGAVTSSNINIRNDDSRE